MSSPEKNRFLALVIGAIGVVYGDIGTSPLYTLREAFGGDHALALSPANLLGVLSLIFWSLILVVSVKYVVFVLRADNRGEGGTFALLALVQQVVKKNTLPVIALGIVGAALLYGDGIITPAISVLSAVEGLEVTTPAVKPYIVPITLAIVIVLFGIQQTGTGIIGKFFGPVTCLWFSTLGIMGVVHIAHNPEILIALNPYHGFLFFAAHPLLSFFTLGTIVLAITGVEALYADMGHFGAKAIRAAWLYFVLPCLTLNYFGQGALLLRNPEALSNPFYNMVPEWGVYPLVALATAATIIASQAMISGAFSITHQAMQLGIIPRFRVEYTSAHNIGQIYIPRLNRLMFFGVSLLVLWFHSSSALAAAYGIAVTGTMTITSCLLFIVARRLWKWSLFKTIAILVPLFIIDIGFFSATLMKLSHGIGAWVPLGLGLIISIIMLTWYEGKLLKRKRIQLGKQSIEEFIDGLDPQTKRVPGTAVYLSSTPDLVPEALEIHLKYQRVLHEHIIIAHVETLKIPHVPETERMCISEFDKGFIHVLIAYGFMQQPNVPRALSYLEDHEIDVDLTEAPYFINRERVIATSGGGMWMWRENMYAFMHRNAAGVIKFYQLPSDRVVELGAPVRI
jgi:KUP system potassium uptake protein